MVSMLRNVISDLINHRDLIKHFIIADFKANNARTYFGFLWWIIDPLLYMLMFYLLVQVILQRGGEDYAVFLFTALIPLKWTTSCLVDGANAITSKRGIIQQVYVPKIIFITVRLAVNTVKFFIGSIVMFIFLAVYGVDFSVNIIFYFVIIFIHMIFLLGAMILLAHIGVYIKDIKNMMQYISRTLFYLSPVMYDISRVPEKLAAFLYLNPLTTLITSYRNIFLYQQPPQWNSLLVLFIISVFILLYSLKVLTKYENHYAKVI
ncbi:ABC transporter permease [Alkalihalobacillus sp. BA299]|uniref:ABC transporter permease n=1 Tax=Alkalihalobacillus sp. BA299 TaxID=2815938 RepID=UPI001ADC5643|nr:ABC transporter permease [Alkalihalobacillus sp. BA299]